MNKMWSHDQDGRHVHINPFKKTFSEPLDRIPQNLVCSKLGFQPIIVGPNYDPGLVLTYFTAWSNLMTLAFSKTIAACDLKVGRCRQLS